ncbi:MAG: hypothetical protein R3F37_08630 [Candidatus Competibacteraceae bacterium]
MATALSGVSGKVVSSKTGLAITLFRMKNSLRSLVSIQMQQLADRCADKGAKNQVRPRIGGQHVQYLTRVHLSQFSLPEWATGRPNPLTSSSLSIAKDGTSAAFMTTPESQAQADRRSHSKYENLACISIHRRFFYESCLQQFGQLILGG